MISLACAALLLGIQDPQLPNPQNQEPARRVPAFQTPSNRIEVGGLSFVYKSDRELGAYLPLPQEGDVWKSLEKAAGEPRSVAMPKLKVQVFLLSEGLTIGRYQGKYFQDRTVLVGPEREAFDNALKQYESLIRASGFEPEVHFTEDSDILVVTDLSQAPALIGSILAPHINDQQFQGEDPIYRGPFDVVLALTSVPLPEIWNTTLDQSTLSVIPISRVSPQMLDVDFASYLYNATCWQIKTAPQTNRLQIRTPVVANSVVPSIDLSLTNPTAPFGRMPSPKIEQLPPESPLHRLPIDTTAILLPDARLAVTGSGESMLATFNASATPPKLTEPTRGLDLQGRIWTIYKTEDATSLPSLLGFETPVTIQGEPSVPQTGELPLSIKLFGHFREVKPLMALEPTPNTYAHFGFQSKGGIELISRKQIPVIEEPSTKSLNYSIVTDSQAVFAFMLYGKQDNLLGVFQISGPKQDQPWITQRLNFTGKEPQGDSIPLTSIKEPVYKIVLGVPPNVIPSSQTGRAAHTIEIKSIALAENTNTSQPADYQLPIDTFDSNAPNTTLQEQVSSSDAFIQIAALGVLADQPVNEQAAFFGTLSRNAISGIAFLACKALIQLGTPEATAELATTLQEGPFDFNRRFAAMAISKPVEGIDFIESGNFLLGARSWYTRVQGARLVSMSNSPAAQTFLVTSLFDPSPNVRGEIARLLDPNVSLSGRRLLFLAVNDASEDIRAICYTKLLEAKDEAVLAEALKGVRDESRLVRLAILARIMATPDEKFRPTYQVAVLDKDPIIQALVLKAFSQLPEPVELGEVSNTVGSNSIPVQLALLQLAQAKSLTLPAAELTRLAESPEKAVSDLAKKLQGGSE